VVLPLLAFSFLHHMGWLGIVKGTPLRATAHLSAQIHAWMLGPMFVFVWSGAYFGVLMRTEEDALVRPLLALALWSAFACWQLNRTIQSVELGLAGKLLAFLLLPLISTIFALATPLLAIAGKL